MGVDEASEFKSFVERINREQLPRFLQQPVESRVLFIAHCINKPKRAALKEYAESLGYKVYIVGGGSIVKKRIESLRPAAVVGIACFDELRMAADFVKIPYQVLPLETDGCENTDFNLEAAKQLLALEEAKPQA
jgi:hypothetical protein